MYPLVPKAIVPSISVKSVLAIRMVARHKELVTCSVLKVSSDHSSYQMAVDSVQLTWILFIDSAGNHVKMKSIHTPPRLFNLSSSLCFDRYHLMMDPSLEEGITVYAIEYQLSLSLLTVESPI